MEKTFCTEEGNGWQGFRIGKTRIRITEHFPDTGRTMVELIEDLILYAACEEDPALRPHREVIH